MSNEIVKVDLTETRAISKEISASQLLPVALRNKPADVLAIVMTGRELGLEPMQSIRGIHIIEGKASLSSDLMGALVKRSSACEYLAIAESTDTVATYKTKRKGEPEPTVMSFTIEQARQAGCLSKANWTKYPAAMLRARALAAICRAVYPDICLGLYDADSGEIVEGEVLAQPVAPQAQHVEQVKEQLRSALVVEGEIVTPMEDRIRACQTADELKALLPEIGKLPESERVALRDVYSTRAIEVRK